MVLLHTSSLLSLLLNPCCHSDQSKPVKVSSLVKKNRFSHGSTESKYNISYSHRVAFSVELCTCQHHTAAQHNTVHVLPCLCVLQRKTNLDKKSDALWQQKAESTGVWRQRSDVMTRGMWRAQAFCFCSLSLRPWHLLGERGSYLKERTEPLNI